MINKTWKECELLFYEDGGGYPMAATAEVEIINNNIVISYEQENDEGFIEPAVYAGTDKGNGHFELFCQENRGIASLHTFNGSQTLEGSWKECNTAGMWKITLSNDYVKLASKGKPSTIITRGIILSDYKRAKFSKFDSRLNQWDFDKGKYRTTLIELIDHIMKVEAPIRIDKLAYRVANAHDWKKASERIRIRVYSIIEGRYVKTIDGDHEFVWLKTKPPEKWNVFREQRSYYDRPIGEIPIEELTVLALDLLLKGVAREDLIVEEMRKYLGLQNLHPSTGKRLRRAVKLALEEGEK